MRFSRGGLDWRRSAVGGMKPADKAE